MSNLLSSETAPKGLVSGMAPTKAEEGAASVDPAVIGGLVRYFLNASGSGKLGNIAAGVADMLRVLSNCTSAESFTTAEGPILAGLAETYTPGALQVIIERYDWVVKSGLMSDEEICRIAENPAKFVQVLKAVDNMMAEVREDSPHHL